VPLTCHGRAGAYAATVLGFPDVSGNDRSCYIEIGSAFPQVTTVTHGVYTAMSRTPGSRYIPEPCGSATPESPPATSTCRRNRTRSAWPAASSVFGDTASGKLARHPELDKAHLVARHGDQLAITKLGRLCLPGAPRRLVQPAQGRGVHLVVLDQEAVLSPLSPNRHPIVGGLPHVLGPAAAANRGCVLVCHMHLLSDLSLRRCRGSRCRGSQHSSSRTKREQPAGEA